jgi:hypothetical protein
VSAPPFTVRAVGGVASFDVRILTGHKHAAGQQARRQPVLASSVSGPVNESGVPSAATALVNPKLVSG